MSSTAGPESEVEDQAFDFGATQDRYTLYLVIHFSALEASFAVRAARNPAQAGDVSLLFRDVIVKFLDASERYRAG